MFIMLLNNYCVTGYRDVNDFSMYTFIYLSTCESERARKNCSDIVFPSAGPLAEYLRLGRMRPGGSWTSGTQPRSLTSDRDPTNRATTCISQSQALQYGMQASQSTYPNHQPKHPPWKIFMYLKKESTLKLQQKHKNPMKKKKCLWDGQLALQLRCQVRDCHLPQWVGPAVRCWHPLWALVGVLAAPLQIQLPTNRIGKVTEDNPSALLPITHLEDLD